MEIVPVTAVILLWAITFLTVIMDWASAAVSFSGYFKEFETECFQIAERNNNCAPEHQFSC